MKKRLLSVLVCILVVSSILTGCGIPSTQQNSSGTSATPTKAAETKTETQEPVTLKILAQESYSAQFSYADASVTEELQKKANVKLEFELVPPNELPNVAQTRLAAGAAMPDIMEYYADNNNEFYKVAQSGLILPLTDLINQYAPNIKKVIDEEYPNFKKTHTMPDGLIYSLDTISDDETSPFCQDLIRADWLKKVGIDKLPETIDEYYNALKAMQEGDANGNGKKDEMWSGQFWALSITFPQTFGLKVSDWWVYWNVDDNGKVFASYASDKAKQMFQFLNKLYEEG